ncbi:lipopolysaccharide biosynthesis protein [Noviherbaspirillum sp. ST9]|uniref:lipopolysaccharide biosynthesis protein n=1 Tax=Noviherbaspirillum sp. ST9 TaxID=3401606 RepID=UPI003B588D15
MSLKHNIVANYVSQLYGTGVAMVMVPVYVRYMGIEAYGLVGFFTMLLMWFQLLDIGLGATMAREAARFQGGGTDAHSLRRFLHVLEGFFLCVAVVAGGSLALNAESIAHGWLNAEQLSNTEVQAALTLMAGVIALRWMSGLYRAAITGCERLVWLSGLNVSVATTRFVLVVPFFMFVGTTPRHFFAFQLTVAAAELAVLVVQTYRIMPPARGTSAVPFTWASMGKVLRFSLSIAFSNMIWVVITQTDKLVLSKLLPLSEYAYFTLAVLVASGVTVVASPISAALQPRLTRLSAAGDQEGLMRVYHDTTQLVGVIVIPASAMLAFFSEQVLWAWTGDREIAHRAAPVLTLYALGNGITALGALPYYLQVAKGDLKLHLIGNALFVAVLIPVLIWAARHYGMIGAGFTWFTANAAYFLLWIPRVHNRMRKGLHLQWLRRDVGAIVLMTLAGAGAAHWLLAWPPGRLTVALEICVLGMGLMAVAGSASSWVRNVLVNR